MGEYADMAVDEMMDFEDLRLDYRTGNMDVAEAYEHGIVDELGYEIGTGGSSKSKTCRCCKIGGLHWEMVGGKWRLFDASGVHKCPAVPLPNE